MNPRLSQMDAFFVAFQEQSGVLMQLGSETDLRGNLERRHFERMVLAITDAWPQLGQRLARGPLGLRWDGVTDHQAMLHETTETAEMLRWRNAPIDPFREPPVQVLWVRGPGLHRLVFRVHHCAADGEAFLKMCIHAAKALGAAQCGDGPPLSKREAYEPVDMQDVWEPRSIGGMLRYMQWLRREARRPSTGFVAQRECAVGETDIYECALTPEFFLELRGAARALRTSPMWLACAAWLRSLHTWNECIDPASNPRLSVEFPVSLRRNARRRNAMGNFVSPLTLTGDTRTPLSELARKLEQQVLSSLRLRHQFGVPLLTMPGRYLPWSLFRRVAVSQTSSGFATTHFSWFEYREDPKTFFAESSRGGLELLTQRIYTPVCLHMGAALSALIAPAEPKLFITYRRTAFHPDDIAFVAETLRRELEQVVAATMVAA